MWCLSQLHTLARISASWVLTCRSAQSLLLPRSKMVTFSAAPSCKTQISLIIVWIATQTSFYRPTWQVFHTIRSHTLWILKFYPVCCQILKNDIHYMNQWYCWCIFDIYVTSAQILLVVAASGWRRTPIFYWQYHSEQKLLHSKLNIRIYLKYQK